MARELQVPARMSLNEEYGSAEEQAERMLERTTQASAPRERRERDQGSEGSRQDPLQRLLDGGRRLLAKPGAGFAGLALITASSAIFFAREARAHRGLRSLGRRSRAALMAFLEPGRVAGPRSIAVFKGLAALALAGVTWKRLDALERSRGA